MLILNGVGDIQLRIGRTSFATEFYECMNNHLRCLFVVNGLGLGNSTRCYSVIEHLLARSIGVHVITSGNGLKFFRDVPGIASVLPMNSFFYSGSHGRISPLKTILSIGRLYHLTRLKRSRIVQALETIQPQVMVTDSEYIIRPAKKRGIGVLAINNSDVVVSEYRKMRYPPREIRGQYRLIEWPDYLWHSRGPDEVLSPSALNSPPQHEHVHRIGLIIRNTLREHIRQNPPGTFPAPRDIRRVLFMLSGSIFATPIPLESSDFPFAIDVVGQEGPSRSGLTYHGKVFDNIELLLRADLLVINAGFSAVSEALALGKPTLVIPVHGHAEQYVNAQIVQQLGAGYVTTENDVLNLLSRLLECNHWNDLPARRPIWSIDGASEAAAHMVQRLQAAAKGGG